MEEKLKKSSIRVGMISLGCAKNLVDGEIMLGSLLKDGMEVTNDPAKADVVIVNTCSFIESAQQESVDAILESAELREVTKNPGQGLIVSGCLPQRFREELPKLLPEVDVFMGIDQVTQVGELVKTALERRAEKVKGKVPPRKRKSERTRKFKSANSDEKRAAILPLPRGEGRGEGENDLRVPAYSDPPKAVAPILEVNVRPRYIPDYATPRFRLTPRHFAYLKIAEGCNHPCSFCTIPQMRGAHRSREQKDVVAEAKVLIAEGVKELNLISQDSTYYGLDLRANHSRAIWSPEKFNAAVKEMPAQSSTICTLLRELNALEGDFWIRLLYTHPAHWTNELIETIAECPKVARYVDIPLQHIHQNMLERMRRETSREYIEELLKKIRAGIPGIALRTTFIVGFPGETEEYFASLLQFIRDAKFERLGVFTYSQEESTRAGKMAGQISEKIKRARRDHAMAAQHKVASEISGLFVGRRIKVLVEKEASAKEIKNARINSWEHGLIREGGSEGPRLKGTFLIARSEADAPDIDGRVYVHGELPIGEFAWLKVIDHTDYDLIAEPA